MAKRKRAGFSSASPEEAGMDPGTLKKIRRGTRLEVRELRSCAGVCHLVLRRGRCVLLHADGWADCARRTPFGEGTICRLHGATKALVCAAFLRLVEQGRVALDDPVRDYINFSERVACKGGQSSRPARVRPTLRHLLTMTSGLRDTECPAYAGVVRRVRSGRISTLAAYCDALAQVPLQSEPGSWYEYGLSIDFIGHVCEVVSGQDLDAFMRQQLLDPLGMVDTHFRLPRDKRDRVAVLYKAEESSSSSVGRGGAPFKLVRWDSPHCAPGILSAAGGCLSYKDAGMWGTIRDYARFLQMLLDGGLAADGGRVLRAATVRELWADGLAPLADARGRVANWNVDDTQGPPWPGGSWDKCGWSLASTLVQLSGAPRSPSRGPARRGHAMGLGGGGGVYWLLDKRRQLVALSFQQSFEGPRGADDGLGPPGNDCTDLAVEAVDKAAAKSARAQPRATRRA